jgi:hypothetical protein
LPADFDVALQGVDTRLKALQPGTTLGDIAYSSATANTNTRLGIGTNGQVLAVSGGVPAWTTTADVTPLTTKGDIFTFTTVDARLGVGTNGQTLVADSTAATGLAWATPASGSTFAGCSLYQTSATAIPSGTLTTVLFDTESIDTDAYHSTATNTGRITIPTGKGGKYLIGFVLRWQGNTSAARDCQVFLNGSTIILENTAPAPANSYGLSQTASLIYPLVAGDYIELKGSQGSGSSLNTGTGGTGTQFFAGLMGA